MVVGVFVVTPSCPSSMMPFHYYCCGDPHTTCSGPEIPTWCGARDQCLAMGIAIFGGVSDRACFAKSTKALTRQDPYRREEAKWVGARHGARTASSRLRGIDADSLWKRYRQWMPCLSEDPVLIDSESTC